MIYLIRHAPTEANMSGSMVKDYNSQPIIKFDTEAWHKKLPELKDVKKVYISDTLRTRQTAEALFPDAEIEVLDCLTEFDCSALGDKKFWELTENEFNNLVHISPEEICCECIKTFTRLNSLNRNSDVICISHGMKIRALIHFYKKLIEGPFEPVKELSAYRIINSLDENFKNLDVCQINIKENSLKIINNEVETHKKES